MWLFLTALFVSAFLSACVDTVPGIQGAGRPAECSDCFIAHDNGTVVDTRTQLMWMAKDFWNIEGRSPVDWEETHTWAAKMNQQRYGGFSDWRIPTVAEYMTTYIAAKAKRSHDGKAVGYPDVFADGGGEWYWTEVMAESGGAHVHTFWIVNFRHGWRDTRYIGHAHFDKVFETTGSIRLVRGGLS
jgi:hypothetical protein